MQWIRMLAPALLSVACAPQVRTKTPGSAAPQNPNPQTSSKKDEVVERKTAPQYTTDNLTSFTLREIISEPGPSCSNPEAPPSFPRLDYSWQDSRVTKITKTTDPCSSAIETSVATLSGTAKVEFTTLLENLQTVPCAAKKTDCSYDIESWELTLVLKNGTTIIADKCYCDHGNTYSDITEIVNFLSKQAATSH